MSHPNPSPTTMTEEKQPVSLAHALAMAAANPTRHKLRCNHCEQEIASGEKHDCQGNAEPAPAESSSSVTLEDGQALTIDPDRTYVVHLKEPMGAYKRCALRNDLEAAAPGARFLILPHEAQLLRISPELDSERVTSLVCFARAMAQHWMEHLCSLDDGDFWDELESHGIVSKVPGGYDPDVHEGDAVGAQRGDDWWEVAPWLQEGGAQ